MASEAEVERLIVRLMGDGTSYNNMLQQAEQVTEELAQEMQRLGATEKEFQNITAKAASVTTTATRALGLYNFEQRRLEGLLNAGRIGQDSFNRQLDKARSALGSAATETDRYMASVARGLVLTNSTENAQERYNRELAEYRTLLAGNFVSQETFNRLMARSNLELRNAGPPVRILHRELTNLGTSVRSFGTSWSIYVTAPLTTFLVTAGTAAVRMDSLKRGLTAVSGSTQEMEKQLVSLREVAKLPGLGFQQAIEGSISLQAAGMSANMAERSLMAFGNALATVGKGKADLSGVNLALTQIISKGKVMAQEINQLSERVPQIRKVMQAAFGTANTEEIGKLGLSSTEFIERIVEQLEKLPKVTGGAQNSVENLSDAAFIAFSKMGTSVLRVVMPAILFLTEKVEKLADWFDKLSPGTQNVIVVMVGLLAVIGPVAVIAGQLTIAVGGLISAYTTLVPLIAAAVTGTAGLELAVGALALGFAALVAVGVSVIVYELSGLKDALEDVNKQLEISDELSKKLSQQFQDTAQATLAMAQAMDAAKGKEFLEQQIDLMASNLEGLQSQLNHAQAEYDRMHDTLFGGVSAWHDWTGEAAIAIDNLEDVKKRMKEAQEFTQKLQEALGKLNSEEDAEDTIESIRATAAMKKETDSYIKSLKTKIETLERGEAATKAMDLAERGADPKKVEEIQRLIAKEKELRDAKEARKAADKESKDVAKDVDTLTNKLQHQVETFGQVAKSAEIAALSERGATDDMLKSATEYAAKLDELKKSQKLTDDIKDFNEKLAAQVQTFGMGADEAELYGLKVRGATDAQLEGARALSAQKKALEENKKLTEEAMKVTRKQDPLADYIEKYKELKEMLDKNKISQEVFNKAIKEAEEQFVKAKEEANITLRFSVEGNDAVRAGTAEFRKLLNQVDADIRESEAKKELAQAQKNIDQGGQFPLFPLQDPLGALAGMNLGGAGMQVPDVKPMLGDGTIQFSVTGQEPMQVQEVGSASQSTEADNGTILIRIAEATEEIAAKEDVAFVPAGISSL